MAGFMDESLSSVQCDWADGHDASVCSQPLVMKMPLRLVCFSCGDVATPEAHTYLDLAAGIHCRAAVLCRIGGEGFGGFGLSRFRIQQCRELGDVSCVSTNL
jgi:DNA-directed RNA polymerase subunit N (RpoN/RPB10)